ncbi:hypothetical protein Zmor_005159 [Zophobas morio]|uniref:Tumor protein p53-inducible nuclear protein 1 n=2 Tax=Zophobas morio TaxID=2755281 RepID=A0AA38ISW7_9CUCU|nr:hypothetical protein Zmor_005159 [Zophobas morio]
MFHQLTRYVFDQWLPQTTSSTAAEGVETDTAAATPTRLTSAETEDDWVLVDRRHDDDVDSEGNSKSSSLENLDVDDDDGLMVVERSPDRVVVVDTANLPVPALLTRTNSASSLPRVPMEESWFLTPPPCFISTGPVHMETSPLENLLIEHPSMSVYTHHGRRYNFATAATPEPEEEVVEEDIGDDGAGVVLVHRAPRVNRVHLLQQQERQGLKSRQAQKVQIKKACKFVKRGSLNRNNKAREVNSRNRRQRRGERSQGATRSFANNNRKC